METLLTRVTAQAMNYAIRSGITLTTTYAIKQCGRLLREAPQSKDREELMQLQLRLDAKIKIISPSIDMIEFISARGNTTLGSAVTLTRRIRYDIQELGKRLSEAANDEELLRRQSSHAKPREETERELKAIIAAIQGLLVRIEDAVPLINLAITTSGVNLSTKLSGTVSPSRLLQASAFLTAADSKYAVEPGVRQQVGPTYTLSLYMLFAAHLRPTDEEGVRQTTWKETIHKARLKLLRVPLDQVHCLPGEQPTNSDGRLSSNALPGTPQAGEFGYQLLLVEDLEDDRLHSFEDDEAQPGRFDDVTRAGIRDVIPVHEIAKIFYADTGKILNIGGDSDVNNPVLLLKRDITARPPWESLHTSEMRGYDSFDEAPGDGESDFGARDAQSDINAQFERESASNLPRVTAPSRGTWRLPADLDPEWIALEVYTEDADDDDDDESEPEEHSSPEGSMDHGPSEAMSHLRLRPWAPSRMTKDQVGLSPQSTAGRLPGSQPPVKTSLSLLEMLIKLTSMQQLRQDSHLAIEDEFLNFFLEDSSMAGAMYGKEQRQRIRSDAVRRVGFDPYDESPVKPRSKQHGYHSRDASSSRLDFDLETAYPEVFPNDDGQEHDDHQYMDGRLFSDDAIPSSPSPQTPRLAHQTPSRMSTPGSSSEKHRSAVHAKYAGGNNRPTPKSPALATPPSTTRSKQAMLRARSDQRPRNSLSSEFISNAGSGDIEPSPNSADTINRRHRAPQK